MFATVFYWCVVVAACLWGAWSLVWSLIYLAKHENGNLWIFAIINALGLIALGILYWIYSSQDNQWYWFMYFTFTLYWLSFKLLQELLKRRKKLN